MSEPSSAVEPRQDGARCDRPRAAVTPARVFARPRRHRATAPPTRLELRADHAAARDAVHAPIDLDDAAMAPLADASRPVRGRTRRPPRPAEHLLRPDLGRRLAPGEAATVCGRVPAGAADLQVVVGRRAVGRARCTPRCPTLLPLLARRRRRARLERRAGRSRAPLPRRRAERRRRGARPRGRGAAGRRAPGPGDGREPVGLPGVPAARRATPTPTATWCRTSTPTGSPPPTRPAGCSTSLPSCASSSAAGSG